MMFRDNNLFILNRLTVSIICRLSECGLGGPSRKAAKGLGQAQRQNPVEALHHGKTFGTFLDRGNEC